MFACGPAFFSSTSLNGSAPHRYWGIRVNSTSVVGNWPNYGELAFLSADGGSNLAIGKTLLTTGSFNIGQNYAFDGMIGDSSNGTVDGARHNVGHPNATVPVIDYVDFATAISVNQVRMVATEAAYVSSMPKDFDIVYSDDGSTWATAWSVTGQTGWAQAEIRGFTAPTYTPPAYTGSKYGAHKYWRIVMFAVGTVATNNAFGLSELQMRATPSGANQCTGGSGSAGETWSGTTVAAAFDGNTTTAWSSTNVTLSNWLKYTFPSPVSVGAVAITARNDSAYGQTPVDFMVEFSDDGTNWHLGWHVLTGNWTLGEQRVFIDPDYV